MANYFRIFMKYINQYSKLKVYNGKNKLDFKMHSTNASKALHGEKKNPIPIKCAEFNMFRRDIHAILGKIMVDV